MAEQTAMAARIAGTAWEGKALMYSIEVERGSNRWTTTKRYSDFSALDKVLAEEVAPRDKASLPRKGLFGFRHYANVGKFNKRRREDLGLYLDSLATRALRSETVAQRVAAFLDAPPEAEGALAESVRAAADAEGRPVEEPQVPQSPESRGPDSRTATPPRPISADLVAEMVVLKDEWERDGAFGSELERLRAADPQLASDVASCARLIAKTQRFQNDSEVLFWRLRRSLLGLSRGVVKRSFELDDIPGKTVVLAFLLLVAMQRPFFKNQVFEVVTALETREVWRDVIDENEALGKLRATLSGSIPQMNRAG